MQIVTYAISCETDCLRKTAQKAAPDLTAQKSMAVGVKKNLVARGLIRDLATTAPQ